MEISGLLRPLVIIYNKLKFFFQIFSKSLIWAPKLHAQKIDKKLSKLL